MNDLLRIFLNNLLPIFLAAGAGFFLSKIFKVSPRPISQVVFYIFGPSLVFSLLTKNNLENIELLRSMILIAGAMAIVGLIGLLISVLLKLDRSLTAGIVLTSMFMNAGNYGLPVILFGFGEAALGFASIFFVTMAILTYTFGIFIASMGSASFRTSILNLFKIPAIYAIIAAFVFLITGWQLPLFLDRTISLLGDASIPTMLVLLGMQLANIRLSGISIPLILAVCLRLIVGPIVALGLTSLLTIAGPLRQTVVVVAGMPTAVFMTVLATEYDLKPSFVTAVVFTSTLVSPLTLTPLLAFMGA